MKRAPAERGKPAKATGTKPPVAGGERLLAAERLASRLDRPMGVLGIIFLLIMLGQLLVTGSTWSAVLSAAGWACWAIFVAEFLLRAYLARFQATFWRHNWWQAIFLLVPFLRFVRALQAVRMLRVARLGGIVSASVRGSRSAARLLTSRIGWLAAFTVIVVLAASQLLYVTEAHRDYGVALYEAAMATITGSGISARDPLSRGLGVVLAVYSVAVFATLAGSLGAYFLRDQAAAAADLERPSKDVDPSG